MLNKNEMIVASSLIAVPLTAILIAMVTRRSRNRLLKRSTLSRQRSSETSTITNNTTTTTTTTITHTHNQQNEEEEEQEKEKARSESESPRQGSNTIEGTATTSTAATTTTSSYMTNSDKDITVSALLAATVVPVVPSPKEPSNSIGSDMIITSPRRTPKGQEISISDEARKAGESLKELIVAAIKDAKDSAKGTGRRLKEETTGIAATTDSKDIQSLRDNVNTLVGLFEKTIAEIRKEHYNEQIKLLESYRDLLQTQTKVVSARGKMASKLKPGA